jgi:hypothetical protein
MIIFTRQARDKRRETSQKRCVFRSLEPAPFEQKMDELVRELGPRGRSEAVTNAATKWMASKRAGGRGGEIQQVTLDRAELQQVSASLSVSQVKRSSCAFIHHNDMNRCCERMSLF